MLGYTKEWLKRVRTLSPYLEIELSIRSLRRWWQVKTGKMDTPIDGEVPFWIVSLGFHLVVIIFLARIMMPEESVKAVSLMLDEPVEQIVEEDIPMEIQFDELLTEEIGADGDDGFETAAAQAPIVDPISEDTIDLEMQLRDVADIVTDNDFIEATAESMAIVPVKGSVGNSVKAASGAVGLETLLPAAMRLVHSGGLDLPTLWRALSLAPSRRLGLDTGRLAAGAPADLVLFDPDKPFVLDRSTLRSKSKNTPFDEARMEGRVLGTWVGGRRVFDASA